MTTDANEIETRWAVINFPSGLELSEKQCLTKILNANLQYHDDKEFQICSFNYDPI